MATFVYPDRSEVGGSSKVNLDNVYKIELTYYIDKNDKENNRYYIEYFIQGDEKVLWAYKSYEDRDQAYQYVQEIAEGESIDISVIEVGIDTMISNNELYDKRTISILTSVLEEMQSQTRLLKKIYNPE